MYSISFQKQFLDTAGDESFEPECFHGDATTVHIPQHTLSGTQTWKCDELNGQTDAAFPGNTAPGIFQPVGSMKEISHFSPTYLPTLECIQRKHERLLTSENICWLWSIHIDVSLLCGGKRNVKYEKKKSRGNGDRKFQILLFCH